MTLQLEVVKVESSHQDEANLTIISLKDKVYPFYVKMFYKAYQDTDIIEIWSEISHQEKKTVVLNQFASAYLPIRKEMSGYHICMVPGPMKDAWKRCR